MKKSIVTCLALVLVLAGINPTTVKASGIGVIDGGTVTDSATSSDVYVSEVPVDCVISSAMLGGDLVISIPDSLDLEKMDGNGGSESRGFFMGSNGTDHIGVEGNLNPLKYLNIAIEEDIIYTNTEATRITVPATSSVEKHDYSTSPSTSSFLTAETTLLYDSLLYRQGDDGWTEEDMSATPKSADAFNARLTAQDIYDLQHNDAHADANDKAFTVRVETNDFVNLVGSYKGYVNFYVSTPNL